MVLRDLIDSETVPVVRLERFFRQKKDSLITLIAHNVGRGMIPELPRSAPSGELQDFYFIHESEPDRIVEKIVLMASERIPARV